MTPDQDANPGTWTIVLLLWVALLVWLMCTGCSLLKMTGSADSGPRALPSAQPTLANRMGAVKGAE